MTHTFKLARRTARFRAWMFGGLLALALGACDNANRLTDVSTDGLTDPTAAADSLAPLDTAASDASVEDSLAREDSLAQAADPTGGLPISDEDEGVGAEEEMEGDIGVEVVEGPDPAATAAAGLSLATAFRGGIPFGTFHLPKSLYGAGFNGSLANISPSYIRSYLEAARRTGTKVIVTFAGNEDNFKTDGRFSLTKWKQRVNRFKGISLSSYIKDGTLMGHYLIDEPHDPANWAGRTVPRATLDEMAKYSKQLWPTLPTVVRSWPKYLKGYNYRYLDAAWAQYSARFGAVSTFMRDNVRDAKASGLALVIGMNQLAGGNSSGLSGYYAGRYSMSASQLRNWGATMLADSYACAFLSWQYNARYMNRWDIKSAGTYLAGKARARAIKSCRGS
ncbi:MAG: hypothetical protein ABI037_11170 [Gemmatimonadales bacterium]